MYLELYKYLFHNSHVEKDASNNTQPHRLIRQLTGLKRNYNVYNYQVSHIWGRTKNIFLFEAPWNLCYTPKIIDPFTGHETQGPWGIEYKELFLSRARERYQPFLDDYNELLETLNILPRVQEYLLSLHDLLPEKEWTQFSKDVFAELSPIR
ncbi:MAG: hypothetical protein Q4C48_05220 [Lachnospiraceae bacterium]|nr:hypothetical protein [Lachnospiraceae bacterium]